MKVSAVIEVDPEFYDAIRREGYEQGRADAIDEFYETKKEVMRWLLKRQGESYGTTLGELLDYIYDYKLKEKKDDISRI